MVAKQRAILRGSLSRRSKVDWRERLRLTRAHSVHRNLQPHGLPGPLSRRRGLGDVVLTEQQSSPVTSSEDACCLRPPTIPASLPQQPHKFQDTLTSWKQKIPVLKIRISRWRADVIQKWLTWTKTTSWGRAPALRRQKGKKGAREFLSRLCYVTHNQATSVEFLYPSWRSSYILLFLFFFRDKGCFPKERNEITALTKVH